LTRTFTETLTETLADETTRTTPETARPHHVIVHNCDCHSFEDVIFGLMRVLGTGLRDAELTAKEIDFFGRAVVATVDLEVAELYAAQLHAITSFSGTLLGTSVEPA
jgi:ATP-dependent Clp protease adapter protein ClpS